jgi:hypothetical protein
MTTGVKVLTLIVALQIVNTVMIAVVLIRGA